MPTLRILVIGGTGTVGREVVRRLLERNVVPRVMTRSAENAHQRMEDAEYVVGHLARPASLAEPFRGIEQVFLLTPLVPNEAELGRAAVRAAADAGVQHVVFQSVHRVEDGPHIPHFRTKLEISGALRESGIPHTLVCPNNFFQNDYWYRDAIMDGVYPQPIGQVGLNRVDVRDIAEAVVTALLEPGHAGESYPVVGPDVITGSDAARVWTRHLGRAVRYAGDDLDAWRSAAANMLPAWLVDDLEIMYRFFQEEGLRATPEELEKQETLLGHAPRRYEDFVAEVAPSWTEPTPAM